MRRILRQLIFIGLAGVIGTLPLYAGLYEKGGANGLGARAMGMAGAYTALVADESAVWWNPAGLGSLDHLQIGTSLGSLYNGKMRLFNFSAAAPLTADAAVGLNWVHHYYSDSSPINTETVTLAGSMPLTADRRLYLGAGLKILFGGMTLDTHTYSGMGFDFGLRYRLPLGEEQVLAWAVTLRDLDTRITWNNSLTEQVPQSMVVGSAFHIDDFTAATLDFEMVQSGQEEVQGTRILRIGMERWFREIIGLRAGYMLDSNHASTFSAGAGFKISGWDLQYALLGEVAQLGISHRLTLSYVLPALPKKIGVAAIPIPEIVVRRVPDYKMELVALPEVFSPGGGSLTDTVVFQLNLIEGDWSRTTAWRLRIQNVENEVVRDFSGEDYSEQFEWDGTDREGKVCPDGTYEATLVLFDLQGKTIGTTSVTVLIRTQMPAIGLRIRPRTLIILATRPQREVTFRMTNTQNLSNVTWEIVIQQPDGIIMKSFSGKGRVPPIVRWDGMLTQKRAITPGTYDVLVKVFDAIGQVRTALQPFTVKRIEPKVAMQVKPRLIKLGDKQGGQATFTITAGPRSEIKSWKLNIRNARIKTLVRTLSGKGVPPVGVVWDCKNQKGVLVKRGEYFQAQAAITYSGNYVMRGPKLALATDIDTEDTGRALALHLTMITFKPGATDIQVSDYKRLKQASETIKKYAKRYRLQIKGYTDNQEAKGQELELAWERARKVQEYLNFSCGIPNNQMAVVGYGARLPLAPETTSAGRAKNRRVEVVLIIQK
ncbi:OmpA family protein [bacterium]|nr:OmpA family protein [bacterium]